MEPNNDVSKGPLFNTEDLRSGQEKPIYNHTDGVVAILSAAETRLTDIEKILTERILRGDGVRAQAIQVKLAKMLGKKVEEAEATPSVETVRNEVQKEIEGDEYLQALYKHKKENVTAAVRDLHRLKKNIEEAETLQSVLEAEMYSSDSTDISLREALDEVRETIMMLKTDQFELMFGTSEEAYFVAYLTQLKELKRQAQEGSIIETASVHEKKLTIEGYALAGRPIFLHGPPGTGKTEMAMHVAKHLPTAKAFLDQVKYENKAGVAAQPFMIISASKQTDSSELTGHQIISVKQMPEDERKQFIETLEHEMKTWETVNPNVSEEAKNRQQQIFIEAHKLTKGQGMETAFWTGPMYKCMEEGIPFIVDEANAMPPDVMIKINHLMTRRPGDTVVIQEDSGKEITIKPGFCFIFTGNIGEQFQGRHRLEQSFVNRIGDAMVEYDYLPSGELQEVIMAYLMEGKNGKGSVVMSPNDMESVKKFAVAVAHIQAVFSGKEDATVPDGASGTFSIRDHKLLKNTPLSMRNVLNIIDAYKKEGAAKPFETYIYDSFIVPIQDSSERYAYFTLFQANDLLSMYAAESGNITRDGSGKVIAFKPEYFGISGIVPNNKNRNHVFTPREVVEQTYGYYEDHVDDKGVVTKLSGTRDYAKVKVGDIEALDQGTLEVQHLSDEMEEFIGEISAYVQEQQAVVGEVCRT